MNTMRIISLALFALFLFQCTEEPPPELFQGTAQDTADIKALMREVDPILTDATIWAEDGKLSDTLVFHKFYWTDTVDTTKAFWLPDKDAPKTHVRVKMHPKEFGRKITSISAETTLVFGIDTTCTVTLTQDFEGSALFQIDVLCSLWYDLDTLPDVDSFKFDSVDFEYTKDFKGLARQFFFFDHTDTGWVLKKVSGMVVYAPTVDSAIGAHRLIISTPTWAETVSYRQPDPSVPGNAGKKGMNTLIPLDTLISVLQYEKVNFEFQSGAVYLGGSQTQYDTLFFRIYVTINEDRLLDSLIKYQVYYYPGGNFLAGLLDYSFTDKGIKYLTFEAVDRLCGYYEDHGYFATVWRMPIEVK
ncbi:hypothetical protein DRP53_05050 [candidate division WOR-3 bacterium]|uniref:Uncharacterized protein n=1 Tax=candidate division WOR-3 bacterium TaxID=2052148 RepID=A0A660SHZ6_UNCW3|nr:MAG: hypothetical protein DRP53_05050 [candidate division WOR-3 bacterium]